VLRRFAPEPTSFEVLAARFSSETAAIEYAPLPYRVRSTLHVLTGMLLLSAVIMGFLSVDRVVAAPGKIVTTRPTLVVQPLETSIIRSLEVRPGDSVKKGAVLATLDATFTDADAASFRQQAAALRAEVARLEAEYEDKPFVKTEDVSGDHFTVQSAIFQQRVREHRSQVASFNQKITALQSAHQRVRQDSEQLTGRLKVVTEVEQMRTELEKKQSGSKLLRLQATDARLEVERNLNSALNMMRQSQADLESARNELSVYIEQWKNALARDLVQKRQELEVAEGNLLKANKRSALVQLTAPEDASVLSLGRFSVGSVLTPGETLVTLVPTSSALEGEVAIDAADYARISVGDPVTIKFLAFDYIQYGTMNGRITAVSEDSFTDNADNRPVPRAFYRGKVEIDGALRNAPQEFALVPGMPFTGDIKIGERTVLGYLFHGMLRTMNEGLRDP